MNVHFVFQTKAGRITDFRLPDAIFEGPRAYVEHGDERRAYEAAVAAYAASPVITEAAEFDLQLSLAELGFDGEEIAWHLANPGRRLSTEFRAL